MEETLSYTQEVLIKFLQCLPVPEQVILSQEAQNVFLKNMDSLKVHYQAQGQDDHREEEEDAHTIENGEDTSGNQNKKIPPPPHREGQEDGQNEEDLLVQAQNTSTPSSSG